MWNPLASLPASNVGALAPYTPAVQPNPVPVGQQPPAQQGQDLHPMFGRHRRPMFGGLAGSMGDPNSFQTMMQAWQGGGWPGMPDPSGAPQTPFDPRQAYQDWRTNSFDPWREALRNGQGVGPLPGHF